LLFFKKIRGKSNSILLLGSSKKSETALVNTGIATIFAYEIVFFFLCKVAGDVIGVYKTFILGDCIISGKGN
jgi:hypothetical protein